MSLGGTGRTRRAPLVAFGLVAAVWLASVPSAAAEETTKLDAALAVLRVRVEGKLVEVPKREREFGPDVRIEIWERAQRIDIGYDDLGLGWVRRLEFSPGFSSRIRAVGLVGDRTRLPAAAIQRFVHDADRVRRATDFLGDPTADFGGSARPLLACGTSGGWRYLAVTIREAAGVTVFAFEGPTERADDAPKTTLLASTSVRLIRALAARLLDAGVAVPESLSAGETRAYLVELGELPADDFRWLDLAEVLSWRGGEGVAAAIRAKIAAEGSAGWRGRAKVYVRRAEILELADPTEALRREARRSGHDPWQRAWAETRLAELDPRAWAQAVREMTSSSDDGIRRFAMAALERLPEVPMQVVADRRRDPDPVVRIAAARLSFDRSGRRARERDSLEMSRAAAEPARTIAEELARLEAIESLAFGRAPRAEPAAVARLLVRIGCDEKEPIWTRRLAIRGLGRMGDTSGTPKLRACLAALLFDGELRATPIVELIRCLGILRDEPSVALVPSGRTVGVPDEVVAWSLGRVGSTDALAALRSFDEPLADRWTTATKLLREHEFVALVEHLGPLTVDDQRWLAGAITSMKLDPHERRVLAEADPRLAKVCAIVAARR